MTKENIKLFSEMHAEPSWLADLRQKAFDKIESLELPVIERVKFHRWNLGDGTITESEPSANVPDFTAIDNHLKLVQVGTQTVFEQTPVELAEQGVVFTDFHSALEEIPELIEELFCHLLSMTMTSWQPTIQLISTVVLFSTFLIMLRLLNQSKGFSTKTAIAMCRLTSIL